MSHGLDETSLSRVRLQKPKPNPSRPRGPFLPAKDAFHEAVRKMFLSFHSQRPGHHSLASDKPPRRSPRRTSRKIIRKPRKEATSKDGEYGEWLESPRPSCFDGAAVRGTPPDRVQSGGASDQPGCPAMHYRVPDLDDDEAGTEANGPLSGHRARPAFQYRAPDLLGDWETMDEEVGDECLTARGSTPGAAAGDAAQAPPCSQDASGRAARSTFQYHAPALLDDDFFTPAPPDSAPSPGRPAGSRCVSVVSSVLKASGYPSANGEPSSRGNRKESGEQSDEGPADAVSDPPTTPSNPFLAPWERQGQDFTEANLRCLEDSGSAVDEWVDGFEQRYLEVPDASEAAPPSVRPTADQESRHNGNGDTECVICTDTKPATAFPFFFITAKCTHLAGTCLECISTAIRTDLSSKLWTELRCPECRAKLEYADVQLYADAETFERYENLAVRATMSEADNFFWCTAGCGSGQIHESSAAQPIVTCLNCGRRSCFEHNVPWHAGYSCGEYSRLLEDPENFRSRAELEGEGEQQQQQQEEAEEMDPAVLAALVEEEARGQRDEQRPGLRGGSAEDWQETVRREQEMLLRQMQSARRKPVPLPAAPSEQQDTEEKEHKAGRQGSSPSHGGLGREWSAILDRKRAELRKLLEPERQQRDQWEARLRQREARQREARQREASQREARQREAEATRQAARRRIEEETKGAATVRSTTKACPSCGWRIAKIGGCSHMTCIKCGHQFCYECEASHRDIVKGDNSFHKETCRFHPNQLPS